MNNLTAPADLSTFKLRRRTPGSFLLVPDPTQGRAIRCQGQLEAAAAEILVACPVVLRIQEQPLVIWYAWRHTPLGCQIQLLKEEPGTRRRKTDKIRFTYTVPDFLVEMADGPRRLIEVKPSHRLDQPIVRRKLAVAHQYATEQGWTYHVLTEQRIHQGPLLDNIRLLWRYRQLDVDEDLVQHLQRRVAQQGTPVCELITAAESLQEKSQRRTHIFHLLARNQLSFDPIVNRVDHQTLVYPGGTISWDPFDSLWAPSGYSTDGPGVWSVNRQPTASSPKM